MAESADGAVVWTLRIPNDPAGDGPFWIRGISERLSEQFDGVTPREVGAWSCVSFDEPGADGPYRWQVCVQPRGRHLWVAQVYYPTPDAAQRYGDRVDAALAEVGGAS